MEVKIEEGWKQALQPEFSAPYFTELAEWVRTAYRGAAPVYPPARQVFAAFDECPYADTRVVIVGQDPYHGPGQANGLAFSVNPGQPFPPSLRNIFKEVAAETGRPIPADGDLRRWARQGVLLLNATLSVQEHMPKSHSNMGWEQFTDAVVEHLNREREGLVFMLWGSDAIRKGAYIDREKHLVLTSPHPSPLSASRGFFGNGHFLKANEYLRNHNKKEIEW